MGGRGSSSSSSGGGGGGGAAGGAATEDSPLGKGSPGTITERQSDYLNNLLDKQAEYKETFGDKPQSHDEWIDVQMRSDFSLRAEVYEKFDETPYKTRLKGLKGAERRAVREERDQAEREVAKKLRQKEWRTRQALNAKMRTLRDNRGQVSRLSKEDASTLIDYLS